METKINLRFAKKEKATLKSLSKKFGMTMSEYVKRKLFDQNSDLMDGDIKYLCPQSSKQGYFLAFSVMKLQRMAMSILMGQKDLTAEEFSQLDDEVTREAREIIAIHGYKKLTSNKDE